MAKKIETPKELTKLILKDVKVLFVSLEEVTNEHGTFKPSISIDATNEEVKEKITNWVAENKIGKNKGVPNFKELTNEETGEVTTFFAFPISPKTEFSGKEGLSKENLGFGATVHLAAKPYQYENFGGGISQSASAIYIIEAGATNNNAEDLEELMEF